MTIMNTYQEVTFVFEDDDGLNLRDFSRYFYYVRILHGLMMGDEFELRDGITPELVGHAPMAELQEHFRIIAGSYGYLRFENRFFFDGIGTNEPVLTAVQHGNSFRVTIKGCLIALVAAVILSGGKADLKNFTFELPPIGQGLKALVDIFDYGRQRDEQLGETIDNYIEERGNPSGHSKVNSKQYRFQKHVLHTCSTVENSNPDKTYSLQTGSGKLRLVEQLDFVTEYSGLASISQKHSPFSLGMLHFS